MQTNSTPLVSVVTPFYNTDDYLSECIESVLRQTYTNWEYIIVNNCSTDKSLEIAESYARMDKRIKVKSNRSFLTQVQNYNHAVSQISPLSKYVKIVQADDWIFPECLSQMVSVAEQYPTVAIVGAYRIDDIYVGCDGLRYPSVFNDGRNICRRSLLYNLRVFGSSTSLLFRSDVVRSRIPFFNEFSVNEDTEVCFDILKHHNFGFIHQVLTFTRRHNKSLSSSRVKLGTDILGKYLLVQNFGPFFLTPEEHRACLKKHKKLYYRHLGRNLAKMREKRYWKYHIKVLKQTGYPLQWSELTMGALTELINWILNPKFAMERILWMFSSKRKEEFISSASAVSVHNVRDSFYRRGLD